LITIVVFNEFGNFEFGNNPAVTNPSSPDPEPGEQDNNGANNEIALTIFRVLGVFTILSVLWLITRQYLARQLIRKRLPFIKDRLRTFFFKPQSVFYRNQASVRLSQRLLQRDKQIFEILDVDTTISKTIQSAGLFTPSKRFVKTSYDYIIFIDKRSFSDLQAILFDEFLNVFNELDVTFSKYYFDKDIRSCYTDNNFSGISLRNIKINNPDCRIIIFASPHILQTNNLSKSEYNGILKDFDIWQEKLIFFPPNVNINQNQYNQLRINGYDSFPFNEKGLKCFINSLNQQQIFKSLSLPSIPLVFEHFQAEWIFNDQIPNDEVSYLLNKLEEFLTPNELLWFTACTKYPEINWNLTTYLGKSLVDGDNNSLFSTDSLTKLAQLPWMRYGRIPKWLRFELLSSCGTNFIRQTDRVLGNLFLQASEEEISNFSLSYKPLFPKNLTSLATSIILNEHPNVEEKETVIEKLNLSNKRFFSFVNSSNTDKETISFKYLKNNEIPNLTIWETMLPLLILLIGLMFNVITFNEDLFNGSTQFLFILSAFIAIAIGYNRGIDYEKILHRIALHVKSITPNIISLFLIGAMGGIWLVSGIIPTVISYSLPFIRVDFFLPIVFIFCSLITMITGLSWTTVGTFGVILIGMGEVIGFPLSMVAGAIVSGVFLGEKMSPFSNIIHLAAAATKVNIFEHLRYTSITTVPTAIVTIIIFSVLGITMDSTLNINVKDLQTEINNIFNIHILLLLPPALLMLLIGFQIKPIIAISISILIGVFFTITLQRNIILQIVQDTELSPALIYEGVMIALTNEVFIEVNNSNLSGLFSSGGMAKMLGIIWLMLSSMVFYGAMESIGAIKKISQLIAYRVKSIFGLVLRTTASCLFINIVVADDYLAILIPGTSLSEKYQDKGFAPENLSRSLVDVSMATSPLIPWSTTGVYYTGMLGIGIFDYFIYAIFNYLMVIINLIFALFKIKIKKITKKMNI
ncbi:MAG: Na+/H+ antiporter NhaC family protein, partial [Bacteroidota bacterium]